MITNDFDIKVAHELGYFFIAAYHGNDVIEVNCDSGFIKLNYGDKNWLVSKIDSGEFESLEEENVDINFNTEVCHNYLAGIVAEEILQCEFDESKLKGINSQQLDFEIAKNICDQFRFNIEEQAIQVFSVFFCFKEHAIELFEIFKEEPYLDVDRCGELLDAYSSKLTR